MDIPESVRSDLTVAAAAAGAALLLTLALELVTARSIGLLPRTAPLFVYFAYAFTRKGGPYTSLDTPRNWALLAAGVAVAVFLFVLGR